VRVPHLLAALAVWQYAEHSAILLFGGRTGDGHADQILAALREHKEGLSRTELHQVLDNNVPALRLTSLLKELQVAGWVDSKKVKAEGKGRPAEVWFIDE
jgi:predicted ArsR family transcriptional regulator